MLLARWLRSMSCICPVLSSVFNIYTFDVVSVMLFADQHMPNAERNFSNVIVQVILLLITRNITLRTDINFWLDHPFYFDFFLHWDAKETMNYLCILSHVIWCIHTIRDKFKEYYNNIYIYIHIQEALYLDYILQKTRFSSLRWRWPFKDW